MAASDVILMVFLFRYSTNIHSSWSLSKFIFPTRTQLCSTKMREQSAADSASTDAQGSKIKPFKIEHISRCVSACLCRAVLTSLSACKTACMIESQEECFYKKEQHASQLSQSSKQPKHVTQLLWKVCPLNPEAQTRVITKGDVRPGPDAFLKSTFCTNGKTTSETIFKVNIFLKFIYNISFNIQI